MPTTKKLTLKDLKLLDLVMSGEAARICAVDRRTFWKKEAAGLIEVAAVIEGRKVYERREVEKLALLIKKEKKERERK
jgi:hypothetical protein